MADCVEKSSQLFNGDTVLIQDRRGKVGEVAPGDAVVNRQMLDSSIHEWRAGQPGSWEVPDGAQFHATVPEAVESVLEGVAKRVFVGEGRHEWPGYRLIVGGWRADEEIPSEGTPSAVPGNAPGNLYQLDVTGEPQSRMWGMWFLEPRSVGSISAVTCSFQTPIAGISTIESWGGPWLCSGVEIRSAGGIALKTCKEAVVQCVSAGIGGLDGGVKDAYGNWEHDNCYSTGHENRAQTGVDMFDVRSTPLCTLPLCLYIILTCVPVLPIQLVPSPARAAVGGRFCCICACPLCCGIRIC